MEGDGNVNGAPAKDDIGQIVEEFYLTEHKQVQFPEFRLNQRTILLAGNEKSGYKAIYRNDELIAIVGEDYNLIPNETAIAIADTVAKEMGLTPARIGADGLIWDKQKLKMHKFFEFPEKFNVGDGDELKMGLAVHNAIDGTMGFGAGSFSFRFLCSNMAYVGLHQTFIPMPGHRQVHGDDVSNTYRRHTKTLSPDFLREAIKGVIAESKLVVDAYKQLAQLKVNQQLIDKVARSGIPKKSLPKYLHIEEKEATIIPTMAPVNMTAWTLYNDVTALLWHNDAEMTTKKQQMAMLHRAFAGTCVERPIA
jgi:hypothetical protein